MSNSIDLPYITRVLEGDKDALRFLIRNHQKMSYSIAISIVKDESDAKDAVQNAFIQVFKSLHSFRQDSKFSTWLYRIVVNESLKCLKKNKASEKKLSYKDNLLAYEAHDNVDSNHLDIEIADRNLRIKKTLKLMKPKEALVLKLFYLNEQRIEEIEHSTGFSKSNIKVLLYRARKSFFSYYNSDKS